MAVNRDSEPHSAIWFGAERDFWWNRDYLALLARRFDLGAVRSALDVGAGVGHWGRTLAPFLGPDAEVVGVDPEERWVDEARAHAPERFTYVQGAAERLPFEDASFDLVTCQTVLIHLPDPRAALREMLRVVRPGGRILAVEPNNRASVLVDSSVTAGRAVDEQLEVMRFLLTCERGKEALGEGNNSAGDLVPGHLAEVGATDVEVFVSDKASALVPPYDGEEQRVLAQSVLDQAGTSGFGWSRDEAWRLFAAGGGTGDDFARVWQRLLADSERAAEAVRARTFHSAGGTLMYVVAARRP